MRSLVLLLLWLPALLQSATTAGAQGLIRPHLDWRTIDTEHFRIHYPAPMWEWTRSFAARVESVHDIVTAHVGFEPGRRVEILVEDPAGQSNGSAFPIIQAPTIVVWPTPPEPGEAIASSSWGLLLAVHEYAHIAHLVRPSRNPRERLLASLLPAGLGPLARKLPRWVTEGYATFIEGRLVGGRPHGTARPAYLRQWALEGRLPTYGQLSGSSGFAGGAMAYLAGSAFLEWLAEQRGDSSLVHLWRRASAREQRSFESAFAGVYGAPPDELYGQFSVEVVRRALEARRAIDSAGTAEGELVQRRRWWTGEPALSRDGALTTIALGSAGAPARIVVWRTEEKIDTAGERRAWERLLARDPGDVPAIRVEPRTKRALSTLQPLRGIAFESPRFLGDTNRILVSHLEPMGDGSFRHDLYVWTHRTGELRRVTRGAAVRDADPSPDGLTAVGVRCLYGKCDLVEVELATGRVETIAEGAPDSPFHRPRFSVDGSRIVVGVHREGRWRLGIATRDGESPLRIVDPDDGANRHDGSFTPDGRAIIAVSDASGIPNLERIDLETGTATSITSVTSAVSAPAPNPADGSIHFLQLHARGLDLRRLAAPVATVRAPLDRGLAPVAAVRADAGPVLGVRPLPPSRRYGLGPRSIRVLPAGQSAGDGTMVMAALAGTDPVGRLGWLLQGGIGERSAWRGASLDATWRRRRPEVTGSLFYASQRPSRQRAFDAAGTELDAEYAGASLGVSLTHDAGDLQHRGRAGASLGELSGKAFADDATRGLFFAEYRAAGRRRGGAVSGDAQLAVHASVGETEGERWRRGLVSFGVGARRGELNLRIDGSAGIVRGAVGAFERIFLGGGGSPFIDASLLSQRIAMPALPFGVESGRDAATVRLSSAIGPVRAYYWIGSAGESLERWHRVVGAERDLTFGGASILRLPTIIARVGAGYTLDAPVRREVRLYGGVSFRP